MKAGDCIIFFNTKAKTIDQDGFRPPLVHATYERDIFISKKIPMISSIGSDDDGCVKYQLPETVKSEPEVLRKSLRQLIGDYLDDSRPLKTEYINSNGMCFSKDQYKNTKWMEKLFQGIETHFSNQIVIRYETTGRGRPPVGEENCIRLKNISWSKRQ
jgi:hypothetical protein